MVTQPSCVVGYDRVSNALSMVLYLTAQAWSINNVFKLALISTQTHFSVLLYLNTYVKNAMYLYSWIL